MAYNEIVERLKATPADPSKAGTGSVWDHIGASARGMIYAAVALGASDDLVYNTLVNSEYGSGTHDGGQTAMFDLLRRLRSGSGGGGNPVDPSNDLGVSTDPAVVLDRAYKGYTWAGNYVGDVPSRESKLAFYGRALLDPKYAGLEPDVLFVMILTNRILEFVPFGSAMEDVGRWVGMDLAAWAKAQPSGVPSL